jgi:hypothetical protein
MKLLEFLAWRMISHDARTFPAHKFQQLFTQKFEGPELDNDRLTTRFLFSIHTGTEVQRIQPPPLFF